MPTSSPREFTSAPPELPTLIAASVWMKSSNIRDAELAAAGRAHDAHRDRLAEAERVADREHDLADLEAVGAAERDRRQVGQVDLQQRELALRVRADDPRRRDAAVRELDADLVGVADHVPVRHDVAAPVDHDAGAERAAAQRDARWARSTA